ncbi:MAG: hypothetical protein IJ181_01225 [Acidaminococcaceae bacterium]|nr:hypothetical protein [Acidaminococcaceae bacterium]
MSENKNLLMDLAKQLISEEDLQYAVKSAVSEYMNHHMYSELQGIVSKVLDEKCNGYIREEIDKILASPVKTDDGWGRVEKYDSFESLVKEKIKEKSIDRSQWNIQSLVRNMVENKIKDVAEKLIKQESKDRAALIIKELAREHAE